MLHGRFNRRRPESRERMIAETSAFLSWALAREHRLPRIPRRRVSEGGFSDLLRRPEARAMVTHWWRRTLKQLGSYGG
ncbi:MAG: hypothetical protein WD118_10195 [Phycisphaeraceae bacterium]